MAIDWANLKKRVESGEFDDMFNDFADEMKRKDAHIDRWVDRMHTYLSTLSDKELTTLVSKYIIWEENYMDRFYNKGILAYSNILSIFCDVCRLHGVEVDEYEDFLSSKNEYRGYVLSVFNGQGTIIRITNKNEILL